MNIAEFKDMAKRLVIDPMIEFIEEFDCEDVLAGNEAFWRARMYAVESPEMTSRACSMEKER